MASSGGKIRPAKELSTLQIARTRDARLPKAFTRAFLDRHRLLCRSKLLSWRIRPEFESGSVSPPPSLLRGPFRGPAIKLHRDRQPQQSIFFYVSLSKALLVLFYYCLSVSASGQAQPTPKTETTPLISRPGQPSATPTAEPQLPESDRR